VISCTGARGHRGSSGYWLPRPLGHIHWLPGSHSTLIDVGQFQSFMVTPVPSGARAICVGTFCTILSAANRYLGNPSLALASVVKQTPWRLSDLTRSHGLAVATWY